MNQSWPCLGLSLLFWGLGCEISSASSLNSKLNKQTKPTIQPLLYAQQENPPVESASNPATRVRNQNGLLINEPLQNSEIPTGNQNLTPSSPPANLPTVSNPPTRVRNQNGLLINEPLQNSETLDGGGNLPLAPLATLEAVTVEGDAVLLTIRGTAIPPRARIVNDQQTQKVTLIVEKTQLRLSASITPSHSRLNITSFEVRERPEAGTVEISFNSPSSDWQVTARPNGLSFAPANTQSLITSQPIPRENTTRLSGQTSPTVETSPLPSISQASHNQQEATTINAAPTESSPVYAQQESSPPASIPNPATRVRNQNGLLITETSPPTTDSPPSQTPVPDDLEDTDPPQLVFEPPTPLYNQQFQFPTAFQLRGGDVSWSLSFRAFFPPESIVPNTSTSVNAGTTVTWGITDTTALSFSFHRVDSSLPGNQGDFSVRSDDATNRAAGDNGFTVQVQQQIWKNEEETQAIGAVLSLAFGDRKSFFTNRETGQLTASYENNAVTPVLQFPYTIAPDPAWQFTIAPTLAFFQGDSAMFYHTAPMDDPGAFGTTFGFTTGISYSITERITLWGDAFFPLTGNNSINRASGQAAQAIVYNAGVRYFVNPRLAMDIYASNSQGTTGAIGLTGDRDLMAFGANLVFMPSRTGSDRYKDSFSDSNVITPWLQGGFGLLDGGVLPSQTLLVDVAGGNQGFNGILNYAYLNDLDLGIYLGYATGTVDESEQGLSARVRLMNQYEDQPLTVTLVGTLGKTNQPFVNYLNNNRNEFNALGLEKSVPFITNLDQLETGELWIVTASLPLQYQFDLETANSSAIWLTPMVGFAQRVDGLPLAGVNVGGSYAFLKEFSLISELGVTFGGQGNMFNGDTLSYALPWTLGLRWNPTNFIGQVNFYVTNRVGLTPWQQMRVRDGDGIAVGVGMSFPISIP